MIEKILQWQELSAQLKEIIAQEAQLRVEITEELFPGAGEGTLNAYVDGHLVKGSFKYNRKVDQKRIAEEWVNLDADEQACFKSKFSLVLSKYKENNTPLVDGLITVKPGMPTLSVKLEED